MRVIVAAAAALILLCPAAVEAGEIEGPGRFCGYAPVIDLLPGEKVTTLEGGIHAGTFRWEGEFGSLEVRGIGWASRPEGMLTREPSATSPGKFAQRRVNGRYEIAIWNGAHGAAYFVSAKPFTALQIEAIDRVRLFEEGQTPTGCDLRTIFVWE